MMTELCHCTWLLSSIFCQLCAKQEDWRKMGEIFSSLCKFRHHPNQVEQISGRIAVALLAESKDKLSLPFAAFADAGQSVISAFSLKLCPHKKEAFANHSIALLLSLSGWSSWQTGEEFLRKNWSVPHVEIPQDTPVGQGKQSLLCFSRPAKFNIGVLMNQANVSGAIITDNISHLSSCYLTGTVCVILDFNKTQAVLPLSFALLKVSYSVKINWACAIDNRLINMFTTIWFKGKFVYWP